MPERRINWGRSNSPYETSVDKDDNGRVILAEDTTGGIVLLEYDESPNAGAGGWISRGPVEMSGNDVTGVGSLTANSIETDEMFTTDSVLVIGAGNSLIERIDPSTTTTPVQDGIDAISPSISNGGWVMLPPGTTQEAGTLTGAQNVTIAGRGLRSSVLEFTDLTSPGITVSGNSDGLGTQIRDVKIDGSDKDNRTAGTSAIHFTGNVPRFNLENVSFVGWNDKVVHADTGHPFSCDWQNVRFNSGSYNGTAIYLDSGGPIWTLTNLYTGNADNSTDIVVTQDSSTLNIRGWNIGGNTGQALDWSTGSGNAMLALNGMNYESGNSPTHAINLQGPAPKFLYNLMVRGTATPSYLINSASANGNCMIGPIQSGGASNEIEITDAPSAECWYFGPGSDITDTAGAATGLFRSLATAGTGNG